MENIGELFQCNPNNFDLIYKRKQFILLVKFLKPIT